VEEFEVAAREWNSKEGGMSTGPKRDVEQKMCQKLFPEQTAAS